MEQVHLDWERIRQQNFYRCYYGGCILYKSYSTIVGVKGSEGAFGTKWSVTTSRQMSKVCGYYTVVKPAELEAKIMAMCDLKVDCSYGGASAFGLAWAVKA